MKKSQEELDRELEKISQELEREIAEASQDERLKDVTFSKEGEDKLLARIAQIDKDIQEEQELQKELKRVERTREEEEELILLGLKAKEEARKRAESKEVAEDKIKEHNIVSYKKKSKRVIFVFAAVMVFSFAMGAVGIGSRYKDLEMTDRAVEDKSYVLVESEEDIIDQESTLRESEARSKVNEFFGQPVVWLFGEYVDMEMTECVIYSDIDKVDVIYMNSSEVSIVYEIMNNSNKVSKMGMIDEEVETVEYLEFEGIDIIVKEYYEFELAKTEIIFEKERLYYSISGINLTENQKKIILDNLFL